jgi:hypothetical protein
VASERVARTNAGSSGMIDEELRDGAQDFVNGLKDKAQGWVGPVVSL